MRFLFDFFVGKPGRLTAFGKIVFHIGWAILLAGIFGALSRTIPEVLMHQEPKSLAELYPSLPVWWVPESTLGFLLALILTAGGAWIALAGRRVDRLYNAS